MDTLLTVCIALCGLVSFVVVTTTHRASVGLAIVSWGSVLWIFGYVVLQLAKTDVGTIVTWTGTAEMDPVTVTLATIGVSLLLCMDKGKKRAKFKL